MDLLNNQYVQAIGAATLVYLAVDLLKPDFIYESDKMTPKYPFVSPLTLAAGTVVAVLMYHQQRRPTSYGPSSLMAPDSFSS